MTFVDWRLRNGWNYISSVRDQGACESCWAFGITALYEAMVRIQHCVWCRRSEGDIRDGVGKQCWDFGNLGEAAAFAEKYGIADPDCFPWTQAAAIYSAREGLGALPLSPTSDRAGRTVRVPAAFTTSDVSVKKQWIDANGPMAVMFNPPVDFDAYHGGIYTPATSVLGPPHCLLVIGFSDGPEAYWIVKNSWGTSWGMVGFGFIACSANLLEPLTFYGVSPVDPDPWTKRRLRNGVLIEGGNGSLHNNFELFIQIGATLEHWWRENDSSALPWNRVGPVRAGDPWRDTFHDDAVDCPVAIQSTFNQNYELLYRTTRGGTGDGRVRHVYYDQAAKDWLDAATFGPPDPIGIPGFVQSTRGAPGDFEAVILRQSGTLEHWTKHNSWPWTYPPGTWYLREQFGSGIAFAGPALVQSRLGAIGAVLEDGQGELHYVCTGTDGQMRHFKLPAGSTTWQLLYTFSSNVTSGPCMIEGQFGASDELDVGNFELCLAANGQIQHWYRNNHALGPWAQWAVFGNNVSRVVALVEGSFGFNLELIAETLDGHYQHYWRDGAGWHQGVIIV